MTDRPSPNREALLPQWSIRFMLLLFVASAIVIWVILGAFKHDWLWAKCVCLMLFTVAGCFLLYAALFLIANLFAGAGALIMSKRDEERTQ